MPSRPQPQVLTDRESRQVAVAVDLLHRATGQRLVGLLCVDAQDRLYVVNAARQPIELIRALSYADWGAMLRMAEEFSL